MGFKCGIVGLPNVGKSTLFNALTKANIAVENYPFCTIDPNIGNVPVPDPRLEQLARIAQPHRLIPAHMEFVDIAGLIQGASQGEGLGNQFLAHIRETQAIIQLVRCFEDSEITHVTNRIDPLADIEVINTELCLADQQTIEQALNKGGKASRQHTQKRLLERALNHLDQGKMIRTLSQAEQASLHELRLLTAKPTIYIANVAEDQPNTNPWLDRLETMVAQENTQVIPICATLEGEIAQLEEAEKKEFLQALGLKEPGLYRIIRAGYALLGLHNFFTAGPKMVQAWTIQKGATVLQAAGRIHTDFKRGFIRAEVIAFADYIQYHGEQGARQAGKWRLEGKDYIVQDGDVILFRFNV